MKIRTTGFLCTGHLSSRSTGTGVTIISSRKLLSHVVCLSSVGAYCSKKNSPERNQLSFRFVFVVVVCFYIELRKCFNIMTRPLLVNYLVVDRKDTQVYTFHQPANREVTILICLSIKSLIYNVHATSTTLICLFCSILTFFIRKIFNQQTLLIVGKLNE